MTPEDKECLINDTKAIMTLETDKVEEMLKTGKSFVGEIKALIKIS